MTLFKNKKTGQTISIPKIVGKNLKYLKEVKVDDCVNCNLKPRKRSLEFAKKNHPNTKKEKPEIKESEVSENGESI